jgi:hypothetical protein
MPRYEPMIVHTIDPTDARWGTGELDAFFNGASKALLPWPSAGRLKGEPRTPVASVEHLLSTPPRLHEVDPCALYASQPWVLRTHVGYYLTGEWELTGRTSADMHSTANRYPTFAERRGQLVIVTGHHRCLAALIQGRPVLARVVTDDRHPVAITPHLAIADTSGITDDDTDQHVHRMLAGKRTTVANALTAAAVLNRLGLNADEIDERLRHAGLAIES